MAIRRSRRDVLADFRAAEILDSARSIFSAKGFDRATIQDIAAAAGIAKGTVYLYYPSKRAVFAAALREELTRQVALTTNALAQGDAVQDQVRSFIRAKAEYYERRPEAYSLFFSHLGLAWASRARVEREVEGGRLVQIRALEAVLRRAARRGSIRRGPVAGMAFALFDLMRGLVERRVRGWSTASLDGDVEATVQLFWGGVMRR